MPLSPLEEREANNQGIRNYNLECLNECLGMRTIEMNPLTGEIVDNPVKVGNPEFDHPYKFTMNIATLEPTSWGRAVAVGHAKVVHNIDDSTNEIFEVIAGNSISLMIFQKT